MKNIRTGPGLAIIPALVILVLLDACSLNASGIETVYHHVDPVHGSDSGDGSRENPWKSLQDVIDHKTETYAWEGPLPYTEGMRLVVVNPGAPVKAGDTILLNEGYYGDLSIASSYNSRPITIQAANPATPRFSNVLVRSSSNWILRDFSVSPSYASQSASGTDTIVTVENHDWRGPCKDVTIDGFEIFSVPDETVWVTAEDWNTKAANALYASGDRVTISDCRIRNVNFGISMTGTGAIVKGNAVDGFCGDGMRGLGDDGLFEYNLVKNLRTVNENHADGFQSWSLGPDGAVGTGVVKNVTLRGNIFIAWDDPSIPFKGSFQGIGCFDGAFEGWTVENNVVISDTYHGISFYGAKDLKIVNNTVLDLEPGNGINPWILVTSHRDGTPSSACVIRNNLATSMNASADAANGIVVDHNLVIPPNPAGYFTDVDHHDLRLAPGSPAIDKGTAGFASALDADKTPRPQGAGIDVGAYERKP